MTHPGDNGAAHLPDFVSFLPDRVYYLTASGSDMWCRRPYGFFFTSGEAAEKFALELGTELPLTAIGVASKELVSEDGVSAMRRLAVTRIFVDPRIDPATGDVFGTILRIAALE
ncbi:MAG: hypothetical protein EXR72_11250 [Myxococcales bacterium]|nr:hypothetical protein [Myxococcales bacterium]